MGSFQRPGQGVHNSLRDEVFGIITSRLDADDRRQFVLEINEALKAVTPEEIPPGAIDPEVERRVIDMCTNFVGVMRAWHLSVLLDADDEATHQREQSEQAWRGVVDPDDLCDATDLHGVNS